MTYIAIEDIYVARGVLAYAKGNVVPDSAVANLDAKDLVRSEGTKAAKEAVQDAAKPA